MFILYRLLTDEPRTHLRFLITFEMEILASENRAFISQRPLMTSMDRDPTPPWKIAQFLSHSCVALLHRATHSST